MTITPKTYEGFQTFWRTQSLGAIQQYALGKTTFVPNLLPELAVEMTTAQVIYLLEKRWGEKAIHQALMPTASVASPVAQQPNSRWLQSTNMVGINVRTIQSFWRVVKYAFTLPACQSSIHLLPIWECGVVDSLYGMSSWHINPEFFDAELAQTYPHLNTVEKQLKVTINVLHLMGKTVGMDVIPHTDRYAEISLANPQYFEWLQRRDFEIVNHDAQLHEEVQQEIMQFLADFPPESNDYFPRRPAQFFDNNLLPEATRLRLLFGEKEPLKKRNERRNQLISRLFAKGYEPVPATMAPPYRGLRVDESEEAKTIDNDQRIWRDYVVTRPQKMSRVFGPLTRYKLFDAKNNNLDWELDFDKPLTEVWAYVTEKVWQMAEHYQFDFMRGDMSHVQMNAAGVPAQPSIYYDLHKYIKQYIGARRPYYAYFAESFLAPPNEMAYGIEEDHLEASDADVTLGDLQSLTLGTAAFVADLARYIQLCETRTFAPCFTVMTADKDDPRFDAFYLENNELRFFLSLFLPQMPSYMALGFEVRDPHPSPAPNEHYSKLYVFHYDEGPKATQGPYHWGQNVALFTQIQEIRMMAEQILGQINPQRYRWVIRPNEAPNPQLMAWILDEKYLCVVNLSKENIPQDYLLEQTIGDSKSIIYRSQSIDSINTSASNVLILSEEAIIYVLV
jgi:hypothetical protein